MVLIPPCGLLDTYCNHKGTYPATLKGFPTCRVRRVYAFNSQPLSTLKSPCSPQGSYLMISAYSLMQLLRLAENPSDHLITLPKMSIL